MRYISLILLFLTCFALAAQPPVIGGWRDHLPYSKTVSVAATPSKIFAATPYSLFYFSSQDNSLNRLTKVNALSDISVTKIAYDATTNQVVVGYANGNLDLVNAGNDNTVNLSDIKRSNVVGDKSIYGICCDNGQAYLALGFGIVLIDLVRQEVKETYYLAPSGTSVKVNDVCVLGDTVFAATDIGIYKAYKNNPFLSDYTNWTHMNNLPPTVVNEPFLNARTFNNEVVVSYNSPVFAQDTAYRYVAGNWSVITQTNGTEIRSVDVYGSTIFFTHFSHITIHDATYAQIENIFQYTFGTPETNQTVFSNGFYWIADGKYGLVKAITPWDNYSYKLEGPQSTGAYKIKIVNGDVWLSGGTVYGAAWLNSYSHDYVSGRVDDIWATAGTLADPNNILNDSLFDIMSIAIDPENTSHVFAGSMSFDGVIEILDNTIVAAYDETNSSLQQWILRPGYCGVTEMVYDEDGNLWMLNAFVDRPVTVRKANGTWANFDLTSVMDNRVYKEMIIGKESGYKWVAVPTGAQNGGLYVWDDGGTITTQSDDQYLMYSTGAGSGNLPSADVLCVAEDLDGEIWIGTGAGIAVVYSQDAVFGGGNFDAQQILITQDGNVQILLETEVITAIAVDGANRKWIGTDGSGVYLMSEDGTEQIFHFTSENSPLFANQINDIEIDHSTGEVYFATAMGVISYRGTATIEENPYDQAVAFPNPVKADYDGVIAIKGLDRDTDIKITDIAGNVVFVTRSEGGQAIWDGKNLKGERVATGIYTVLCKNQNGKGKAVAKILFIN